MAIKYYKLLDLLNRRGINKDKLRQLIGCGPNTIAKIAKNEYVSLATIDKMCEVLECQPGDLMEYTDNDK